MFIKDWQRCCGLNALGSYLTKDRPCLPNQFRERDHCCSVFAAMDDFTVLWSFAYDARNSQGIEC
jgi:hypothetical protein